MRKALTVTLVLSLSACARVTIDPHSWLIDSWDHGVFTIKHEGKTYTAACNTISGFRDGSFFTVDQDGTRSDWAKGKPIEASNQHPGAAPRCEAAIARVGHSVQPFADKKIGNDGWTTVMGESGTELILQRTRDENLDTETFRVLSVTQTR